jgi:F-type H+-transporting ATPase subunit gamma
VLLITSDRGLAGAYSSSVIKAGEQLSTMLHGEGKEVLSFLTGRKAAAFFQFRRRPVHAQWEGFSDAPSYANAREIADALINVFRTPTEDGGVDEIHVVYTRFVSMLTQTPEVIRLLPLEVVEGDQTPSPDDLLPLYEFEPDAETVLDELLPLYVASRIQYCPPGGGLGAGQPAEGDEVGDGQRAVVDRAPDPGGQPGPAGRDHPGNQRDRRRGQRPGRRERH